MKLDEILTKAEPKKMFDFTIPEDGTKTQTIKIRDTTIILSIQGKFHNPEGIVKLASMRTPASKRGKGSAKYALGVLTDQADKEGVTLILDASPLDGKTKLSSLVDFYKANGFVETGEVINRFGEPEMIRRPK